MITGTMSWRIQPRSSRPSLWRRSRRNRTAPSATRAATSTTAIIAIRVSTRRSPDVEPQAELV